MTTLVPHQLAARLSARSLHSLAGYADESLGRLFGRNNTPPPAATPAPTAANPGTRTAPVVIADLPTAPAAPGGFAAAVARRSAEPATPTPIIPVYVPPTDAFRGEFNGDPASVPEGEILSRTSSGRLVRTLPPPRGPGGQHFGTTADADGRIFRDALNAQLQRSFPGETIDQHLGNPNRDTSILRGIGTVAAVATPVAAIVAPWAAPAVAAVAASANAGAAGGNVGTSAITAALGTALSTSTASNSMNLNTLIPSGGVGGIASGLASSLGASSQWAGVFGNLANSILPGVLGNSGGSPAVAQPPAPAPPVIVTTQAAQSNTPLIIGGVVLLALLALGGKRR